MTASERRNAILEDLCMRRFERINNLAFQYGVTERTIRNDIMILSLEYPIYTAQGFIFPEILKFPQIPVKRRENS